MNNHISNQYFIHLAMKHLDLEILHILIIPLMIMRY